MFGKKKSVEPSTKEPVTEAEAGPAVPKNASVDEATRWLKSMEGNRDTVASMASDAQAALVQAEEKHSLAVAAFNGAAENYGDDASEQNAKAVRDARDSRDVAEALLNRSKKAVADAARRLAIAEEAVAKAQEDIATAERTERIAELQAAASVKRFQEKARPTTERFLRARTEMHAALDALVTDFESANAAASELLALGEPAQRLDHVQLIAQYCVIAAEKNPTLADGFIRALQTNDHVPGRSAFNGDTLRASLEKLLTSQPCAVDQAGRNGLNSEDRAGRGDPSSVPLPIEELHDFFRDTRGAWTERVKARRERQKLDHADESKRARKEAARAARLVAAEST